MAEPGLPADWIVDREDKERLIQALFVSLVLHILFLSIKLPQQAFQRLAADSLLTVTFAAKNTTIATPLADGSAKQLKSEKEILTQTQPTDFILRSKPASPVPSVERQASSQEPVKASAADAMKAAESRYVHKPGEARVLLEVNSDGQIGQIIWDMLPALSDEQFNRLEAAIRARGHPGPSNNNFVKETINVRDYLDANH